MSPTKSAEEVEIVSAVALQYQKVKMMQTLAGKGCLTDTLLQQHVLGTINNTHKHTQTFDVVRKKT